MHTIQMFRERFGRISHSSQAWEVSDQSLFISVTKSSNMQPNNMSNRKKLGRDSMELGFVFKECCINLIIE